MSPGKLLTSSSKGRALALSLILLAITVRVIQFGQIPGGLNQDEAMAAYEAYSLALYGTDRFGTPFPAYFHGWGFAQMNVLESYLMIPFIKLFGLNAVTVRLPMLITGIGGLFALYRFAHIFGKSAALAVLAFAAVAPWHIMQSRWALESNLFPHMLMLGFWLLYEGTKEKEARESFNPGAFDNFLYNTYTSHARQSGFLHGRKRGSPLIYVSMILFGLSMYAYGIAFFAVPMMLAALCAILLHTRTVNIKQACICAAVYLAMSLPIFAVMAVNFFDLPTLRLGFVTIENFPSTQRMSDLLFFSDDIPAQIVSNLKSMFDVLILQQDGLPWSGIPMYGLTYIWSLPFTLFGIGYSVYKAREQRGCLLLLCWMAVALLSGLITNYVNFNRIKIIHYPLTVFTGLGLYRTVKIFLTRSSQVLNAQLINGRAYISSSFREKQTPQLRNWIVSAAAVTLVTVSFGFFSFNYFFKYNEAVSGHFYEDFYTCLDKMNERDFDTAYITAWTQSQYSYNVSEILTLYGARVDPASFRDGGLKYQFVSFYGEQQAQPQAVYLFNSYEAHCFPQSAFAITDCGDYRLAVPLLP
jgi:hypothetical protein